MGTRFYVPLPCPDCFVGVNFKFAKNGIGIQCSWRPYIMLQLCSGAWITLKIAVRYNLYVSIVYKRILFDLNRNIGHYQSSAIHDHIIVTIPSRYISKSIFWELRRRNRRAWTNLTQKVAGKKSLTDKEGHWLDFESCSWWGTINWATW